MLEFRFCNFHHLIFIQKQADVSPKKTVAVVDTEQKQGESEREGGLEVGGDERQENGEIQSE